MDAGRCPRAKGNGAAYVVAKRIHGPDGVIHHLLNTLPVRQQGFSGSRRLNPSSGTLHQPRLQKLLQLAYLQADGGLGEAQHVRCR